MQNEPANLSDRDLIAEVKNAAANERSATAALIALLGEFDDRRLYLGEGCSSLFAYCTRVLRLSEHAAYGRIAAARAARRWPNVLSRLTNGEINLTTVVLLAPHLTEENHEALLEASAGKSKSEIERLIAALHPQPDIESSVRRLPVSASASVASVEPRHQKPTLPTSPPTFSAAEPRSPRPVVAPLASERYLIKVTVSAMAHANLKRAQDLLRHTNPTAEPAAIIERALAVLVGELEKTRCARVSRPKTPPAMSTRASRYVRASVRRVVWSRDGGRCAFVGAEGRCAETGFLEFHHLAPFADHGLTTAENLSLRCRAHNLHEAHMWSDSTGSVQTGFPTTG